MCDRVCGIERERQERETRTEVHNMMANEQASGCVSVFASVSFDSTETKANDRSCDCNCDNGKAEQNSMAAKLSCVCVSNVDNDTPSDRAHTESFVFAIS